MAEYRDMREDEDYLWGERTGLGEYWKAKLSEWQHVLRGARWGGTIHSQANIFPQLQPISIY